MSSTSDDSAEGRLVQVGDQLQIPRDTLQITRVRLNQLSNEPELDQDSLDNVAAAALALSCREDGVPVSEHDIAKAWTENIDAEDKEVSISHEQLEAVGSFLDIEEVPPHPDALVQAVGEAVEMSEDLVNTAHRILHDAFEADAKAIANGPSPAATAAAVLSLAAELNGEGDTYDQDTLGKASGTNGVMVQNRRAELNDILDDRLDDDAYQIVDEESDSSSEETGEAEESTSPEAETESTDTAGQEEQSESEDSTDEDTAVEAETTTSQEEPSESEAQTTTTQDSMTDSNDNTTGSEESAATESTAVSKATDGAGTAETATDDGVTAEMTTEAVETEIDTLVEDLDIGASARLLARGMVGDAVTNEEFDSASVLAGATVVAASRMEDADSGAVEVAGLREYPPRAVLQTLDTLDETVDVDIPRRSADEIIDELIDELGLPNAIREESLRSLERYQADETAADYTPPELGSSAVMFATTVSSKDIDVEDVSAISGADPEYITTAMNSITVSLCLGLVRGTLEYDDCAWTNGLLDDKLAAAVDDAYTSRIIGIATTYAAGREAEHIDDSTLNAILTNE